LHLQRKMGKQVIYKAYASASEGENNKENKDVSNKARAIPAKDDGSRIAQLRKAQAPAQTEIQKSAPKPDVVKVKDTSPVIDSK